MGAVLRRPAWVLIAVVLLWWSTGSGVCRLQQLWHAGLAALWHMASSQTGDGNLVQARDSSSLDPGVVHREATHLHHSLWCPEQNNSILALTLLNEPL